MKDALSFLIDEHNSHRRLIDRSEKFPQDFHLLRNELIHHINMEEEVLYPILLQAGLLEGEIRNAWEEHRLMMLLLQEMDRLCVLDKSWQPKFHALKKILLSHINEEEIVLFPKIKRHMAPALLEELTLRLHTQKCLETPDKILYPEVPHSHEKPHI